MSNGEIKYDDIRKLSAGEDFFSKMLIQAFKNAVSFSFYKIYGESNEEAIDALTSRLLECLVSEMSDYEERKILDELYEEGIRVYEEEDDEEEDDEEEDDEEEDDCSDGLDYPYG